MAERRTVAEVQGSEQEWKVSDYDWDPTAVQARKRRAVTKGGDADEGGNADAAQGPAGLSLDEQLGLNIGLLQPQLWPTPILSQLPVLNIDKDDDEPATVCQVEGCNVSLLGLKRYYVINRVCEAHLRSPAIIVNGTLSRFCQQCNKFQFIGKFSGSKRSCTYKLERHNARHRAKMQQKRQQQQLQQQGGAGTGGDVPAADDGGSGGEAPPSPARKRRPAAAVAAKKDSSAAATAAAATGTRRTRGDAASPLDDAMHAAAEAQVRSQVVPQPQKAAAGGPGGQPEQSSGGEAMDGVMPYMGRVGSGSGSAGCATSSFNRAVAAANGAPQGAAVGGGVPGTSAGRARTGAEVMKLEAGGTVAQAANGAAPNGHSPYGTYDAHAANGAPDWAGLQAPPPGGQPPRYPDVQAGAPTRVMPGGGSTGVPTPPAVAPGPQGEAPWDAPTAGANGNSAYPYLRNSDASANAGGWQQHPLPLAPALQRPDRDQAAAYPRHPDDSTTPYSRPQYPAAPYDVACALGATHPWIPPPPPPPPVLTHGSMGPTAVKRESSGSPPATGAGFAVPGSGRLVDPVGRGPHDGGMQPYPGAQNQMEGSSSRSNSIKALADVGSGGVFEAAGGSTAAAAAVVPAHANGSPAGLLLPGAASPGPASSEDGGSAAHGAAVSTGSGRGSFGAAAARGASTGTASAAMAGTPEGAPGPVVGHVAARISSIMQELGPLIDQIKRQVGQAPGSAGAAAVAALTSAAEGIATSQPGSANRGSGSGTQTPAVAAAATTTAAAAVPGGAGSEQLPMPLIDAAVEMLRRAAELANVLKPQDGGAAAAPTSVQPPPTHVKAQPQASAGSAGRPGGVGTPAASEGRVQDGSAGPLAAAALSGGAAGDSSFDAAAAVRANGGTGTPAEHANSGSSGGMVAWPAPGTTASGGAGGGSALAQQQQQQQLQQQEQQQQQQQRSALGPLGVTPSWGNAPPPSWPAHLNDVGFPRAVSPARRLPYGHSAYASGAAGGSAAPYQDGPGLPTSPYQSGGPSPYGARVHRYPGRHVYSSYPPYAPYPTYDGHSAGPYGPYPSYHPHMQHPVYGAQAGPGAGAPGLPAASARPATVSGGSGPASANGPASNGPALQARPASNGSYPVPYNGSGGGSAFAQRGINNTMYAAGSPAVNELPYQGGQPTLRPMHSNTQSDTNSAAPQPQLAMPSQHGGSARGGDRTAAEMFAADQHLAALGSCAGGAAGVTSGGGAGVSGGGGVDASGGSNNALDADLFSMLFDLGQEPDPFPGTGSGHVAGGAAHARDLAAFHNQQQQRDDNLMYGLAGAAHRAVAADQRAMSAVPYGGAVPPPTGAWQAGQALPSAGLQPVQTGYASGSGRDGMYQHPLHSTHGSVPPTQMLADPYYPYGSTQPSQRAAPAGQYGWEHGMASVPPYQQQQQHQHANGAAGYPVGMGAQDDVDYAELERVSLKVMNLLPHELPHNMRSNLRRWLKEGSAELQQATLRPGCVQLVVDCMLRRAPSAPSGSPSSPSSGSEQLAATLIPAHDADQVAADVFRMLGQRLRDTFVQVGRQVLQIRMGEDPVVLGWEEAAEDGGLPGAKMPVVEGVSAPAVCAGSEATLELRGLNLQQQQRTKPYARLRGHDLAATAVEASGSRSRNSGVLGVRVSLPGRAVGLMVVEVGVGHLLGGWWPVLVLPPGQEAAAEELRRVQEQQQRQGDTAGARRLVMDFSRVLETAQAALEAQAAAQAAAAAAAANRYLLASPVEADAESPVAANMESAAAAAAAASRSSSPDSMYGTSMSGGASHAGFTFTSGVDSTALGSTNANTLSTGLATSTTTGVARIAAAPVAAAAASGSAAAASPALGGGDGAAGAAAGPGAAAATLGAVPAVPPPPMPSATALRQAIMRAGRLGRFAVSRGLPHCTALLLASAERLASALAATNPMPTATSSRSPSPHHQQHQREGAEGTAHEEQQQELVIALLSAAGLSPQALLPLAVVSGCPELVDVLAAFSERVVGAPLRADLPQGPYGMSLLHVAAALPDGGAMACALLRAVPWAAWGWVCVGWMPPQLLQGAANSAAPPLEVEDVTEEQEGAVEGAEEQAEEERVHEVEDEEEGEGDGELAPLQERVWLTPGALAAVLGRQGAPLRAALSVLRGEGRREGQVPVRPGGGVGEVEGRRGEVVGALAEAVRVCCTVSSTMMQLLCDELARQRL